MGWQEIDKKISDLYSKPRSEKFSEEEIKFIMRYAIKKKQIRCFYAIWKQKRKNEKYLLFLMHFAEGTVKRSAIWKSIEIIESRPPTDIEHREAAENFGCNNRICTGWNYKGIEQLIAADKLYNIETPVKFVNECFKRKYSASYQIQLNFE